jgi:hypothetical protein
MLYFMSRVYPRRSISRGYYLQLRCQPA